MRVVQKALTFDDVLLVPAHSAILPREVSLKTRLTRGISLNIPLLSAAMDSVTESRLAIAIAQEGGIGIVHKNMTPKAQAAEVTKVKRFESGIVKDPITISKDMTVRDVLALTQLHRISGLPVVEADGKVVGKFGSAGKQIKEFGLANSIDCRNENELLIGEMANWRVQKVSLK